MGVGQSSTVPPPPPTAAPPGAAAAPPGAAGAGNDSSSGSGGLASFLPPPTIPRAQLVAPHSSAQSTSVLDSPTSCTGIFDQLWFCLCERRALLDRPIHGRPIDRGPPRLTPHIYFFHAHFFFVTAPVYQAREYYVTGAWVPGACFWCFPSRERAVDTGFGLRQGPTSTRALRPHHSTYKLVQTTNDKAIPCTH